MLQIDVSLCAGYDNSGKNNWQLKEILNDGKNGIKANVVYAGLLDALEVVYL